MKKLTFMIDHELPRLELPPEGLLGIITLVHGRVTNVESPKWKTFDVEQSDGVSQSIQCLIFYHNVYPCSESAKDQDNHETAES